MNDSSATARYVVDRIENAQMVLEDSSGRDVTVSLAMLPKDCRREGAVLDVELDAGGAPQWTTARVNRSEEERLRKYTEKQLDALRLRDRGGDVEL